MGCPCKCEAIFCRQPTQRPPLGLLPSPLHAWVLTLLPEHTLILKAHMLTQKLFASLSLSLNYSPHDSTFQQGLNCLVVMMDEDPVQSISQPVVSSLLVLQSEFEGGQHAYLSVPSGIEVWGCKDIHQWIVVSLYHK